MFKAEAEKKQTELLNALHNEYDQMGYEVERTSEEDGLDVLSFDLEAGINNDPVLASSYFLPVKEEEADTNYYVLSLALTDEIESEQKKLEMLQAIAVLNYNVPYGSFVFDTDIDILSYKYVVPVHESMDKNNAFKLISGQTFIGFGIVNLYIAVINAFLYDRITWDEYIITLAELLEQPEE